MRAAGGPSPRRAAVEAAAVALAAWVLLVGTAPPIPIVWDEGNHIVRAAEVAAWARLVASPGEPDGGVRAFGDDVLSRHWGLVTAGAGHPALFALLIAAGSALAGSWCEPLVAARLGTITLAAVAAGAMFYRLRRLYSGPVATAAVVALFAQPRLFADLHFATLDGLVTSCWVLAWAAFAPALESRRGAVLWGIALGLTLGAKFTGWLAPIPFLAWAVLYRPRGASRAAMIGLPVALCTFVALHPPLWPDPFSGLGRFLALNTTRAARPEDNVTTYFLGQLYDTAHSLPWYNTIVWTGIAVPAGILFLAAIGLLRILGPLGALRLPNPPDALLVANCAFLLVVRALPGTPPHDGIRLILPSYAFLAAIAGLGLGALWDAGSRWRPARRAVAVACLAGSASSVWWYFPQDLSYYNLLAGGLRGAVGRGMEPTYFWDGLDREVLAWLETNTRADEKIGFGDGSPDNLRLLRRWGTLGRGVFADEPGRYRWYVVQSRPSTLLPEERWLLRNERPAYRKTIRPPSSGLGPWRLDVPILQVYSDEQYRRALGALTDR